MGLWWELNGSEPCDMFRSVQVLPGQRADIDLCEMITMKHLTQCWPTGVSRCWFSGCCHGYHCHHRPFFTWPILFLLSLMERELDSLVQWKDNAFHHSFHEISGKPLGFFWLCSPRMRLLWLVMSVYSHFCTSPLWRLECWALHLQCISYYDRTQSKGKAWMLREVALSLVKCQTPWCNIACTAPSVQPVCGAPVLGLWKPVRLWESTSLNKMG